MAATRLRIERRAPVLGGQAFGAAGAYEAIAGVLEFAVDPALPGRSPTSTSPRAAPRASSSARPTSTACGRSAPSRVAGDPRPSLEERYGSRAAYLARLRDALGAAVAARSVLAEDVDAVCERAGRLWDLLHAGGLPVTGARAE